MGLRKKLLAVFMAAAVFSLAAGKCAAADESDGCGTPRGEALWAWGTNNYSQLGDGTRRTRLSPVRIGEESGWIAVEAGWEHTVALREDGSLWGWGRTVHGEAGVFSGRRYDQPAPSRIGDDDDWAAVSTGRTHSLAIKKDSSIWGWGNNYRGRLGSGTDRRYSHPHVSRYRRDEGWKDVSAGGAHTIALKKDNSLWGWGWNGRGQVSGAESEYGSPLQIGEETGWMQVSAGGLHSMAIKDDGTLWGWGGNCSGQLGDPSDEDFLFPVRVGDDSDWRTVSAGYSHTLALKEDGSLWAWGNNKFGQLGDGTTKGRSVPERVGSGDDWVKISSGYYISFGIKKDGSLWGWGRNDSGRLGDGTLKDRHLPGRIGDEKNWLSVASGFAHTVALKGDGE